MENMDHKDKLEAFIKKQINSIEPTGADEMWTRFQVQHPIPIPRWKLILTKWWPLMVTIGVAGAIYGWYASTQAELPPEISATVSELDAAVPTSDIPSKALVDRSSDKSPVLPAAEQAQETASANVHLSSLAPTVGDPLRSSQHPEGESSQAASLRDAPQSAEVRDRSESILQLPDKAERLVLDAADGKVEIPLGADRSDRRSSVSHLSGEMDRTSDASPPDRPTTLSAFPTIAFKSLSDLPVALPPHQSIESSKAYNPLRTNSWFAEFQSLASFNRVYRQSVAIGYGGRLNRQSGFELMAGIQFIDGQSLSLDSTFISRGISLREIHRNNDLDYLVDLYLSSSYTYQVGRFQMALGGQLNFGFNNQFHAQSSELVWHNGRFERYTGLFSHVEKERNVHWDSFNRIRLGANFRIGYQLGRWQLGASLFKQLNRLQKEDVGTRIKSNNDIQIGFYLRHQL
ncbi:MAG: hypothetical protein AAF990_07740 [Bacteroidota bacterium]